MNTLQGKSLLYKETYVRLTHIVEILVCGRSCMGLTCSVILKDDFLPQKLGSSYT